jgi:UDP-N-acetylglucosamine diphosphorylase/glucosamine-1-phosphate N-acetyltransferase
MNYILSDFGQHINFLPLTFTRSLCDFRIGILTIKEKWEHFLNQEVFVKTESYLQPKYRFNVEKDNIIINTAIIPDDNVIKAISDLKSRSLVKNGIVIAYNCDESLSMPSETVYYEDNILIIKNNTDIFTYNGECIERDFEFITKNRDSAMLSNTNKVIGNNPVFVEDGCFVECCTINTINGPVYIGENSTIMEGGNIRGPFALCNNSEIKMGAKIYGPTTIGPWCKAGGEINNSVFFAYSNKAHDGFLGNSVIGEWCNLGADTNNSNLKNNYATVKLWNYEKERFISTGLQFCGLIMGDHSKCGINTMFNTGTVIGVSANIFGAGFPRNFIPSFSWGGHGGMIEFKLSNAFDVMEKVMQRRNKELTETDKKIFNHIFDATCKYRSFY